jgi:hypothetical protein
MGDIGFGSSNVRFRGKADIASGISKTPHQPIENLNAGAPAATYAIAGIV